MHANHNDVTGTLCGGIVAPEMKARTDGSLYIYLWFLVTKCLCASQYDTSARVYSRSLNHAGQSMNNPWVQGACVEADKMLLITEFMDGGDLFKAIARKQVDWSLRCAAATAMTERPEARLHGPWKDDDCQPVRGFIVCFSSL